MQTMWCQLHLTYHKLKRMLKIFNNVELSDFIDTFPMQFPTGESEYLNWQKFLEFMYPKKSKVVGM